MTVLEALSTLNSFPVPDLAIEKVCLDRELELNGTYTKLVGESQGFELATADLYVWLANTPNIVEQAVGISNSAETKKELMDQANQIYGKYDDVKFTGITYGFVGENFND
jgi:hypothetical protein